MMTRSLSGRITLLTLIGTAVAVMVVAVVVLEMFERSLDRQLDNHLTAYNDILSRAVWSGGGKSKVLSDNPLLEAIPRHWQIDLPGGYTVKSHLLKGYFPKHPYPEITRFAYQDTDGTDLLAYQQYFNYPEGQKVRITFGLEAKVAEAYRVQLREQFSRYVYLALGVVTGILLLFGFIIVKVVTRPLRQVSLALEDVRAGKTKRMEGVFPQEIATLSEQINQLLDHASGMIARHREFSNNLAHALKTPLAVIRNESDSPVIRERADAILQVLDRNLARLRTVGGTNVLSARTPVEPVVRRIADGFGKLYRKEIEITCTENAVFHGDEADLYELLGNLIENACKFGHERVRICADEHCITLEDDGPGIAEAERDAALMRGTRLDETKPGSGIGLSIARDIIRLYGGELQLGASDMGGLKVDITLPR